MGASRAVRGSDQEPRPFRKALYRRQESPSGCSGVARSEYPAPTMCPAPRAERAGWAFPQQPGGERSVTHAPRARSWDRHWARVLVLSEAGLAKVCESPKCRAPPLPRAGQAAAPSSTPELLRGTSQTAIACFSPELASLPHQTLRQTHQGRAESLAGGIFRVSPSAQGGFRAQVRHLLLAGLSHVSRGRAVWWRWCPESLCERHQDASEPGG